MKNKIYTSIAILVSLLLLASCSASPESATRNMTSADYENNKETIEKIDVAKSYLGMLGNSSEKGLSIDNQAKTITYEVDEPIRIIRNDLIEELPILSTLLPQTSDFWIISGKTSISFAGYESIAKARTIDDIFKVVSMNLVFADNKEGTINRTEVLISYEGGFGTLKINGEAFSLASLEEMEQHAEAIEEVLETLFEEEAIYFNEYSYHLIAAILPLSAHENASRDFSVSYQDIEDDEKFIIEGTGSIHFSKQDNIDVYAISIEGKLTDSEDDKRFNLVDESFKLKFNIKIGKEFDLELEEASIGGIPLWDSFISNIESDF